jgi:hypothetical protein
MKGGQFKPAASGSYASWQLPTGNTLWVGRISARYHRRAVTGAAASVSVRIFPAPRPPHDRYFCCTRCPRKPDGCSQPHRRRPRDCQTRSDSCRNVWPTSTATAAARVPRFGGRATAMGFLWWCRIGEKESRQKSCRKFSRKVRAQESEASGERARHFGGHMLIESNHKGTKISFKFASPQNAPSEPEDIVPQEDTAQPA